MKANPAKKYRIRDKIGNGQQGKIFECERKADKKLFALKLVDQLDAEKMQDVINECSLMQFLSCDQLIQCGDIYFYKAQFWIVLELMGGDISSLTWKKRATLTEGFCKWSLYQVALGL